jgi:hypothetical protein
MKSRVPVRLEAAHGPPSWFLLMRDRIVPLPCVVLINTSNKCQGAVALDLLSLKVIPWSTALPLRTAFCLFLPVAGCAGLRC